MAWNEKETIFFYINNKEDYLSEYTEQILIMKNNTLL